MTPVARAESTARRKRQSFFRRMWKRCYSNKATLVSLFFTALLIVVTLLAPLIAPYDPFDQDYLNTSQPPSAEHLFGTDNLGRDIASRVIVGSRISLTIGAVAVAIGMSFGVTFGLAAGYFGGVVDEVMMRMIDVLMAFPGILLAILVVSVLGSTVSNVILALAIFSVPTFARLTRASVLSVKELDYVTAAYSIGIRPFPLILRHILPNISAPIIIYATLRMATAILGGATLGFLGLGVSPPTPEWGLMVSDGRHFMRTDPHIILFPGLAIFLTVLSLNLLGDALRDVLDPKGQYNLR